MRVSFLVLGSQSLPLLWGMSPLSPLANDGQLKAHSQSPNQIYSPLIGLKNARGRAFISVSSFLFLSSCLRFSLRAGVACGGLSDGQKQELSAELGVWAEPKRDRSARSAAEAWPLQSILMGDNVLSAGWGSVHRLAEWEDAIHGWHWERKQKGRAKSETSLSSFPHCQRIHSLVPRVQCQTKHMSILVFLLQIADLKIEKSINWSRNRASE